MVIQLNINNLISCYKFIVYTRYQSKCWILVGIKMTLGKGNTLSIVILWFTYLTQYKVILNPSKKRSEPSILNGNGYGWLSYFNVSIN
jgi:hypothetical protein